MRPNRTISPRLKWTRIAVPPTHSSLESATDHTFTTEITISLQFVSIGSLQLNARERTHLALSSFPAGEEGRFSSFSGGFASDMSMRSCNRREWKRILLCARTVVTQVLIIKATEQEDSTVLRDWRTAFPGSLPPPLLRVCVPLFCNESGREWEFALSTSQYASERGATPN